MIQRSGSLIIELSSTCRLEACDTGPGERPPWQPALLRKQSKAPQAELDKVKDKVKDKVGKNSARTSHERTCDRRSLRLSLRRRLTQPRFGIVGVRTRRRLENRRYGRLENLRYPYTRRGSLREGRARRYLTSGVTSQIRAD